MKAKGAIRVTAPADDADRTWLCALWKDEWGGDIMVTGGQVHRLADLQALLAWDGNIRVGTATYRISQSESELISLNATVAGKGVGTALLKAVEAAAAEAGCDRVWLITTNDNLEALKFYQRRGYRLIAVHSGAVDQARVVKPAIPMVGRYHIPLHDELRLEKRLQPDPKPDRRGSQVTYSADRLAEFTAHIEQSLSEWTVAMQTGDTSRIESDMAADIVCYFGRRDALQMEVIDREGIVMGMRQSAGALRGCTKRFENRIIRMRSDDEGVVFYEQVVERDARVLARLFTMETYRRVADHWVCIREVVEHTGA